MTEPRWERSCPNCVFLGQKDHCDLHWCPDHPDWSTAGSKPHGPFLVLVTVVTVVTAEGVYDGLQRCQSTACRGAWHRVCSEAAWLAAGGSSDPGSTTGWRHYQAALLAAYARGLLDKPAADRILSGQPE